MKASIASQSALENYYLQKFPSCTFEILICPTFSFLQNLQKMSCSSDRRLDLNAGEEAVMSSPDNIWHPSFLSPNGPLTVGDSVMKNDITAAVVARNLLTPRDNRVLSKRSDELAV